jgi:hypothetical protein
VSSKRIDDLWDLTVQGIWEAHLNGELAEADVVDQVADASASPRLVSRLAWTVGGTPKRTLTR